MKSGVRVLRARRARKPHTPVVSLSVFSLVPDLLFDCSRVLEYAKIRTVLQSSKESICNKLQFDLQHFTAPVQPHTFALPGPLLALLSYDFVRG